MEHLDIRRHGRSTTVLKGLGSAGYQWSWTVDDLRIVDVQRVLIEQKPEEPRPPTWSADETFALIRREADESIVRFNLSRPFEPKDPPVATREFAVHVG
jgi:hypothetical protein